MNLINLDWKAAPDWAMYATEDDAGLYWWDHKPALKLIMGNFCYIPNVQNGVISRCMPIHYYLFVERKHVTPHILERPV